MNFDIIFVTSLQSVFNHVASMQLCKLKHLHKKRVQLPQDLFGTPTWPSCFALGHHHGRSDIIQDKALLDLALILQCVVIKACAIHVP